MSTGGSFGGGKCAICGAPTKNRTCKACYLAGVAVSTPLREVRRVTGKSLAAMAREADVPVHTFRRYGMGNPVGGRLGATAIRMAKVTGLSLETILLGTVAPAPTPPTDTRQLPLFGENDDD